METKKNQQDFFSFPGIVEVVHSSQGKISGIHQGVFVLLFSFGETTQRLGYLIGLVGGSLRVLGVMPFSLVKKLPELRQETENHLEELLDNPTKFLNVNVITTLN